MNLRSMFLACGLLAAAAPMYGSTIAADGTYHEFLFGGVGTFASACAGGCTPTTTPVADQTATLPYTFSGPGSVFLLDLFVTGDEFALYDNSVLVGDTSTVANTGAAPCAQDIACAIANTGYSRGTFSLGAGSHSLTIQTIQLATGSSSGAAVLKLSAATTPTVPEPDSMVLMGTGLSALGMLRLRARVLAGRRRKV